MSVRFLTTAAGRAPGEHACWPYRGADELLEATRGYVAEGLARHELVAYFELSPDGMAHTVLTDLADVGRPPGTARPVLAPLAAAPPLRPGDDPTPQLQEMTRAALADGFSGLRVLTEVTEQVRTPQDRSGWARTEHLIDEFAVDHPTTTLCSYDVDALGEATVAELACLHSLTRAGASPFLLRAAGGGTLALSGEVDVLSADDLHRALLRIGADLAGTVVVDASDLRFVDHGGLVAIERAARALDRPVHLRDVTRVTGWLARTLGLTRVGGDAR